MIAYGRPFHPRGEQAVDGSCCALAGVAATPCARFPRGNRQMKRPFVLVIVAAAMACGPADTLSGSAAPPGGPPDGGAGDGGSGAAPAVVITSPPDGAHLAIDDHGDDHFFLDVVVELRNVRVAADCGSESSCGRLARFAYD